MSHNPLTSTKAIWPIAELQDTEFHKRVPGLEVHELENGIKLLILSDKTDRSSYLRVTVNAGSIHQPITNRGISHFTEHMLFQGTEEFGDATALVQHAEDFNLNWNGYTSHNEQEFFVECDNDAESLEAAARHLSQVVLHSSFPEDKIAKEREVVHSERQANMSDPMHFTMEVIANHFYSAEHHPFAGGGIVGEEEKIKAFTRDHALEFWRTYFNPANMQILAVGGRPARDYKKLIEKYFGGAVSQVSWKTNPLIGKSRDTDLHSTSVIKDFNHVNLDVGIYFPNSEISMPSLDYFVLKLASEVLSTRAFLDIRDKQGLAYAVWASTYNLDHGFYWNIGGEFMPTAYKKGREELEKYTQLLIDNPVDNKEFDRVLRRWRSVRWARDARSIATKAADWLFTYGQLMSPEGLHHWYDQLELAKVNKRLQDLLADRQMESIAVGKVK